MILCKPERVLGIAFRRSGLNACFGIMPDLVPYGFRNSIKWCRMNSLGGKRLSVA